jgi:hypothetical protein
MKIRLKWTNVAFRVVLLAAGVVLLALTQGGVVRFVYQGY